MKGDNEDETTGIEIVKRAIEEPLRQIVANAGKEGPHGAEAFCGKPVASLQSRAFRGESIPPGRRGFGAKRQAFRRKPPRREALPYQR